MYVIGVLLLLPIFIGQVVDVHVEKNRTWNGAGTIRNLESIVIGRCYSYIRTVNPSVGEKNCSEIWEAFKLAFASMDPCTVLPSDYQLYINLTLHEIPINKSLFWEQNKQLVHRYADKARRFMPLGDSLMSWIADGLTWCGKTDYPGIDYVSCPTTQECENNAVESFWRIASVTYARISSGIINVMLNGSSPGGAFPIKSFFTDYELPNFQFSKIAYFEIWVMDEVDGPDVDSCEKGSLITLGSLLYSSGYRYKCTDNYRPIRFLQCVDSPSNPVCAFRSPSSVSTPSFSIVFLLTTASIIYGTLHL